jgi:hypothetical protein
MPQQIRLVLHHCEHCDGPAVYCVLDGDKRMKPLYGDEAICIGCGRKFLPNQLTGKQENLGPVAWTA